MNLNKFTLGDLQKLRSVWEAFRATDDEHASNVLSRDALSHKLRHGGIVNDHEVYMLRTASSNIPGDNDKTIWQAIRAILPEEEV
jgi:hypothetical protein